MDWEQEFAEYVGALAETLEHADRVGPLRDYCRGLMLSGDRKSVEPMAALVAPRQASAKHQSMHHFVAKAEWSDAALLSAVRREVLPALGASAAWIVDDTGYPKKGKHSVGVAWRRIEWRKGSEAVLASRFARVRARAAHRNEVHPEEWLVIEWPLGETEPTQYWLATPPESIAFRELIRLIKLRWRIERDYQELKQELGLGHYEGRNWRGFHHHATLTIAAYGFLMRARLTGRVKKNAALRATHVQLRRPPWSENFLPRGSPRAA